MVNQLEFMDCPNCGKRIRTIAPRCHHCKQVPIKTGRLAKNRSVGHELDEDHDDSHMALDGGYDSNADEFDYETFVDNEFGKRRKGYGPKSMKLWVWLTAWLLLVLAGLSLVAFVLP